MSRGKGKLPCERCGQQPHKRGSVYCAESLKALRLDRPVRVVSGGAPGRGKRQGHGHRCA